MPLEFNADNGFWMLVAGTCALILGIITFAYFAYRAHRFDREKRELELGSIGPIILEYENGHENARSLLKGEYHGRRAWVKAYLNDERFDFEGYQKSTMAKVLQPSGPPNTHYIQKVHDDLAPGQFKVLPPGQLLLKQA